VMGCSTVSCEISEPAVARLWVSAKAPKRTAVKADLGKNFNISDYAARGRRREDSVSKFYLSVVVFFAVQSKDGGPAALLPREMVRTGKGLIR